MDNKLKPIETEYHGYKFRSRLEARWAVFFDTAGVEWEYEPEGFELPSGLRYLPDFRLHGVSIDGDEPESVWAEVKGVMDEASARKIEEFYRSGNPVDDGWSTDNKVIVLGSIPDERNMDGEPDICSLWYGMASQIGDNEHENVYPFGPYSLFGYGVAGGVGVLPLRGGTLGIVSRHYMRYHKEGINVPLAFKAFRKARQARFEHGACG